MAHLRGPADVALLARLLLFIVSLRQRFDQSVRRSVLSSSCRAGGAEGVAGFFLPDPAAVRSVVCQHPGQILAAVEMLHDAGPGEAMTGQDVDGPRMSGAVRLPADQRGGRRVFEKLPFPAPVQLLQVLVEERR